MLELLSDDLNSPGAISELHQLYSQGDGGTLRASAQLLGLMTDVQESWMEASEFQDVRAEIIQLVEPILRRIDKARTQKDYETADRLRNELRDAGVKVNVTSEGCKWDYTLQDAAKLRDKEFPEHGLLGATVHIAGWMRDRLEAVE
jgi:cysteinyl-tRNA synthetase